MADLSDQIAELYAHADTLTPGDKAADALVTQAVTLLDQGHERVAYVDEATGEVVVNEWLKQAILLLFRLRTIETINVGPFEYADKLPLLSLIHI